MGETAGSAAKLTARAEFAHRRGFVATGCVLIILGLVLVACAVGVDLGLTAYLIGVTSVVLGCLCLLVLLRRWRIRLPVAVLVVVGIFGGAMSPINGLPWGGPASSPTGVDTSATVGAVGGLTFVDSGAYETSTGTRRWHPPDPDNDNAVAATPDAAVYEHDTASGARLIAYQPGTGKQLWTVKAAKRTSGVAFHDHVLVTDQSSRAVAYDLRTGAIAWTATERATREIDLRKGGQFGSVITDEAGVVLTPRTAGGKLPQSMRVVRTVDGHTVLTTSQLPTTGRVVGGMFLSLWNSQISATSLTTGEQLWTAKVPDWWAFAGEGSSVFMATNPSTTTSVEYEAIDLHTGKVTRTAPPPGWSTGRYVNIQRQRGAAVWELVANGDSLGVWQLGTTRVVPIPHATNLAMASTSGSGWLALSGDTKDLVGGIHDNVWALSPSGRLSGPFPGTDAYISPGLVYNGDKAYPADN